MSLLYLMGTLLCPMYKLCVLQMSLLYLMGTLLCPMYKLCVLQMSLLYLMGTLLCPMYKLCVLQMSLLYLMGTLLCPMYKLCVLQMSLLYLMGTLLCPMTLLYLMGTLLCPMYKLCVLQMSLLYLMGTLLCPMTLLYLMGTLLCPMYKLCVLQMPLLYLMGTLLCPMYKLCVLQMPLLYLMGTLLCPMYKLCVLQMSLLYLMGTLLCPMTLLWEPVCELIATHARGLEREQFWGAFSHWLKFAAVKAVEELKTPPSSSTDDEDSLLDKWMEAVLKSERRPDHASFRNLLWKAMSLFPEKCEPKSRDVVPLFLDFLEKEYYLSDLTVAPTQNIQADDSTDNLDDVSQDDTAIDDFDGDGDEGDGAKMPKRDEGKLHSENDEGKVTQSGSGSNRGKGKGKSAVQSLLVHLNLFAKFQNPKSLYQEEALRDVFFQVKLDCVMTYRYKFLTPYRENFERLLDDKTFKTEVVLFSVDAESSEIKPEHRQDLLPVLMRILYGKMLSKAGTETSGKRRVDIRRSIVFRFLAGCSPEEMQYFLDLVFGPFKRFVTDDPFRMVKKIITETDLTRVVPPKRMKGVLGAVVVVTEKLGHLLASNARSILHLLLGVAATCNACLKRREEVRPAAVTQLKSVRLMAITRLIQFFDDFDKYQFRDTEIDAIMEAFVWPQLDRLTLESKCQPHFFLLVKEQHGQGLSPLAAVFSLLTTPGVSVPVSIVILKTVENLLEDTANKESKSIGEGVKMVRPFVPALLSFIEGSIHKLGSHLDKNRKAGATKENLLELKILARDVEVGEEEEGAEGVTPKNPNTSVLSTFFLFLPPQSPVSISSNTSVLSTFFLFLPPQSPVSVSSNTSVLSTFFLFLPPQSPVSVSSNTSVLSTFFLFLPPQSPVSVSSNTSVLSTFFLFLPPQSPVSVSSNTSVLSTFFLFLPPQSPVSVSSNTSVLSTFFLFLPPQSPVSVSSNTSVLSTFFLFLPPQSPVSVSSNTSVLSTFFLFLPPQSPVSVSSNTSVLSTFFLFLPPQSPVSVSSNTSVLSTFFLFLPPQSPVSVSSNTSVLSTFFLFLPPQLPVSVSSNTSVLSTFFLFLPPQSPVSVSSNTSVLSTFFLFLPPQVSVYIEDDEQSVRLCSLLMPFFVGKTALQQQLEESTLESVLNLMKTVKNPQPFYRSLLPLFLGVERRQSRILLCQILKVVGEKVPALEEVADIVEKLNAWNPRQTEEPDYSLRLETFRLFAQRLKEWTQVNADFLLAIIYNCFFFIRNFDDLSLRDNSTHCLVTIVQHCKALNSDPDLYKEIIAGVILPEIKKGLRSKQEAVRHEFLAVLQALVLAYPEQREFLGLSGLRDTDVDSDFFENIRHIQIHKQTKALRRLSRYLHSHKLRADQHMGFFVPLLYSYLLDQRYAKSGGLLDASVDLTCMICRQLPWENYYQLLRLYLSHLPRHLETQRTIIKVIVAILDGFHFDLSQSQFVVSNKPKVVAQATSANSAAADTKPVEVDGNSSGKEDEGEATEENAKDAEEELSKLATMAAELTDLDVSVEFSAERKDVCAPGLATRIHRMVLQSLIPQLHKTLTEKVKSDEIHKLAQVKYAEDEEILRVPIAMAMIKLLQKLPSGALEHKLPGILLRVCNFLKSRAQDIRMTARDTLVKAVQSLGPRFLPFIIKEMRAVLTRGYQLHVLSFSVHYILRNMLTLLKPGDLDPALNDLHAVFQEELFGAVSEEKDVEGITSKLFEAKTIKGYLTYEIIAQYISPDCLGALVKPLKMVLEKTHSQRTANKVRLVLQRISSGLINNTAITMETMMVFVHSLTADNLPMLREEKPQVSMDSEKNSKPQKPQSCLILPAEIPRGGVKPKSSKKTTLDVLVEFGLLLLHACLKKSMLEAENSSHLGLLDPLVPSLLECLSLKYVRVNSATLRCMCRLLSFPLPTLKKKIKSVARELFVLLKNYASAGAAKGDNQELVFTCFKAVTVLVREVKYYKLSAEHLQVLLTFCEEDIHDHTRQSTAFSAILQRKLNVPELHELMSTMESMSITAEAQHLRLQCRQVVMQYLLDYPMGKKLQQHVEFFVSQLSYEREDGRQSALEILLTMFDAFPQHTLDQYAGLLFVPLSVTLINDESTKCRKMASLAIKSLLEKVDVRTRDSLFSITFKWMSDKKVSHRMLSAQLAGLFVEVEPSHFERVRLSTVFPLLLDHTDPIKFHSSKEASEEQEYDHWLFNLMTLLSKILRSTDILQQARWREDIGHILEHVREHLLYPHSWVRLVCCQIFGQVFASTKQDGHEIPPFLAENTQTKMKKLVQQMCSQLQSPLLDDDLASQVVKNLVFLAKLFHLTDQEGQFSLGWLARKLTKEANFEKIHNTKVTVRRNHVFKWVAAVSLEFSADIIKPLLPTVLPSLQREAEDNSHDDTLKTLAQEVIELLKKKVGVEEFSAVYTNTQQVRQQRKEARKVKRAVD
ncbi:hypothetical protein BaRGS_00028085, partial [Batillaria attramentaria]